MLCIFNPVLVDGTAAALGQTPSVPSSCTSAEQELGTARRELVVACSTEVQELGIDYACSIYTYQIHLHYYYYIHTLCMLSLYITARSIGTHAWSAFNSTGGAAAVAISEVSYGTL